MGNGWSRKGSVRFAHSTPPKLQDPSPSPFRRRGPSSGRSNSHPVAGRAGCTNIPLSAVEAQEDGTTLQHGTFSQMIVRSVHLDPAGLIRPRGTGLGVS
jgi:hypothetical protein